MKKSDLVLLSGKNEDYIVEVSKKKFHTKSGIINLKELQKKKFGNTIKSHLGKEFTIIKPNINDIIRKKVRRSAQVILPKDAALILAYTGLDKNCKVVDIGTGTGYLSIFLANYSGKVVTYEKDKNFYKNAKENIKISRLKNLKIKLKDATKGISEKNVDLITVDIENPKSVIEKVYKSLKIGGWLVVYSPHVEEFKAVVEKIKRKSFSDIKTVENIVREWQVEKTTRPKTIGLMHTGFLTFARKVK